MGLKAGDTRGQGKALILPITEEVPALLFPLLRNTLKPSTNSLFINSGRHIKPYDAVGQSPPTGYMIFFLQHIQGSFPGSPIQCLHLILNLYLISWSNFKTEDNS